MKLSVTINANPETVFAVVSDVKNGSKYIEGCEEIEMLTNGPMRVGSKWRETRRMNNRASVEHWEMKAFESPNFFSAYCDSQGYDVNWTMRVTSEGTGTRLTLEMSTKPRTFFGKLLTPIELLMSGTCRKIVQKDLEDTKRFIEGHRRESEIVDIATG